MKFSKTPTYFVLPPSFVPVTLVYTDMI